MYTHTHARAHTHACIHTHTRMYTHTHTHTHTRAHKQKGLTVESQNLHLGPIPKIVFFPGNEPGRCFQVINRDEYFKSISLSLFFISMLRSVPPYRLCCLEGDVI